MKHLDIEGFVKGAEAFRRPYHAGYYAMYSSVYDAVVTDPLLMTVPIDDHLVHRGDGVFETFKCVGGRIYNLQAHLDRLTRSAAGLHHKLPVPLDAIRAIVVDTVRAGGRRDCLVRVFIARGSGGFGVSPYECPVPGLYVVAHRLKAPFMELHPEGARVIRSRIPAKEPFFAGVKNCNYLPNVLMKKDSDDAGVDFPASFDARGCLAEGATENFGIVTRDGRLLFPRLEGILAGTTMLRVIELARTLVPAGGLAEVGFADIAYDRIADAAEMLVVGTTIDVTAVREFDGRPVGDGRPGPIYRTLSALFLDDVRNNRALLTTVFED